MKRPVSCTMALQSLWLFPLSRDTMVCAGNDVWSLVGRHGFFSYFLCLLYRNHICLRGNFFWKDLHHDGTSRTPGVIPQAVEDVFQSIKNVRMVTHVWNLLRLVSVSFHPKGSLLFQPKFPKKEFLLRVSYMEIYNETVTDLLVDSWKRKPLEVREQINVGWSFRWLDSERYLEVWFSAFLC